MQQNEPTFYKGLKIDGFKLIRSIGSGGTAEVWEAEDDNLNAWALKIFSPTRGMDDSAIKLFKYEFIKTEKLVHPNILRARRYGEYQNRPYITFDLCDTSLMKLLHERIHASRILSMHNRAIFKEEELSVIIFKVANALEYLHEKGIVHQDIKPDNILVKTNAYNENDYLISDFGVSTDIKMTILRDSQMLTDSNKGLTPDYASPELYQGAVITATDIFALGISIYELCTGKPPISNTSMTTAIALLNNNGFIPDLPQDYSQRFNTMVKKCLELHPEDRPTAADLVEYCTFYHNEGYWPEHEPNPIPPPPEPLNIQKFVKPIVGGGIIVMFIWLLWALIIPNLKTSDRELTQALSNFDIKQASSIYQDMTGEEKSKFAHLDVLAQLSKSRVEQGSNFAFLVVKDINTHKLGLMDKNGQLKIPVKYDQILKIFDPKVVTVKIGNICSHIDLISNIETVNGKCKVYKSRNEFLKDNK
ncbi:MAG: serine/threonine protein kinase [Saprospiraceae bacterium]|nr:serine/threonine protein kinase [Saprospiraceae bacterium]